MPPKTRTLSPALYQALRRRRTVGTIAAPFVSGPRLVGLSRKQPETSLSVSSEPPANLHVISWSASSMPFEGAGFKSKLQNARLSKPEA
jgi:hypothetical protein